MKLLSAFSKILGGRIIVMVIAGFSSLLLSGHLGPIGFGVVASVIALGGAFSSICLAPLGMVMLREDQTQAGRMAKAWHYIFWSGGIFFLMLLAMYLMGDVRAEDFTNRVFYGLVVAAAVHNLAVFSALKHEYFMTHNFLIAAPEVIFFISVATLLILDFDLDATFVIWIWIGQMLFSIWLGLWYQGRYDTNLFRTSVSLEDYLGSALLGVQNVVRDRLLLVVGPILFTLKDVGIFAFYLLFFRLMVSLNGSVAALIISKTRFFKASIFLLIMWIAVIGIVGVVFYASMLLISRSGFFDLYQTENINLIFLSIALVLALSYSVFSNFIFATENILRFASFQVCIIAFSGMLAAVASFSLNMFELNLFINIASFVSVLFYYFLVARRDRGNTL